MLSKKMKTENYYLPGHFKRVWIYLKKEVRHIIDGLQSCSDDSDEE